MAWKAGLCSLIALLPAMSPGADKTVITDSTVDIRIQVEDIAVSCDTPGCRSEVVIGLPEPVHLKNSRVKTHIRAGEIRINCDTDDPCPPGMTLHQSRDP